MGKSYKKTPRCGDIKFKTAKKLANRKVRYSKELYQHKSYKKLFCSWEICDYQEIGISFEQFYLSRKKWCSSNRYYCMTEKNLKDYLNRDKAKQDYLKWYVRK